MQLNHTVRIISDTVTLDHSNNRPFQFTLSNIAPQDLRRLSHTTEILHKVESKPTLPLHIDILGALKSRAPIWRAESRKESVERLWARRWEQTETRNWDLIKEPFIKVPGRDSPRAKWTAVNRMRTGQGGCNHLLRKWDMAHSTLCECGEMWTNKHMVETCSGKMFEEGLAKLHEGGPAAVKWLEVLLWLEVCDFYCY